MFVRSTGAFENSANVPVLTAETVQIKDDEDGTAMLAIKLYKGATIAYIFHEMLWRN